MTLFDTHCHIDEEKFDEDRDEVLARMTEHGVTRFAVIGTDVETSRRAVAFAQSHDGAVAAVGFHPHEASRMGEAELDVIRQLTKETRVQAIGEIGLDYYYDLSPREVQQQVVRRQLDMAWDLDMPVAFHIRDAHQDMLDILKERRTRLTGGIIHCFSGSWEIAKEYLKLGYYISFAGPVTFKKAPKLQEAALHIPQDRLLIETDSPYMAP